MPAGKHQHLLRGKKISKALMYPMIKGDGILSDQAPFPFQIIIVYHKHRQQRLSGTSKKRFVQQPSERARQALSGLNFMQHMVIWRTAFIRRYRINEPINTVGVSTTGFDSYWKPFI